ncbi:MAG: hypothetical protein VKL59_05825 [Nostocaceae cyanobacterium]|nr:hypothetical protein [Nostocaceae cyanobacterium]
MSHKQGNKSTDSSVKNDIVKTYHFTGGLTSSTALTFTQSNGDTLISAGTDLLATLKWVQLAQLG